MGEFDLNLSTRPFPAYQLKTLSLIVALIALVALSVWQTYGFLRYSRLSSRIKGEAQSASVEARSLNKQVAELDGKLNQPEAKNKLSEIEFLNNIIVRKTFSWTRVFAVLEDLMPPGARLNSLRPSFQPDGSVLMTIEAQAHSMTDVQELLQSLQASPSFDDVIPHTGEKEQTQAAPGNAAPAMGGTGTDIKVSLTARYHPEREEQ